MVAVLATGAAWAAPQVEVFTPQGQAKGVRQVAVRFTEPMVAFGDPRLPDPFTVRCEGDPERLKGRGRWADQRNWAYDFDADLPAGQRCRFTVNSDLKSAGGQPEALPPPAGQRSVVVADPAGAGARRGRVADQEDVHRGRVARLGRGRPGLSPAAREARPLVDERGARLLAALA